MTVKVLEKDIIKTDGFIMIDQNICIELTEKRAFLTFKGENIGEFTKKQAGKMKVSLKKGHCLFYLWKCFQWGNQNIFSLFF